MNRLKVFICCAFLFPAISFAALTDSLRLADVLQSNMVIQQNKPFKIWEKAQYQGKVNHLERESYVRATQTMINSWRRDFSQDQLPVYYVQIAPFFRGYENPVLAFDAYFREAQEREAQEKIAELNNTYMVSTMDVGEEKDLHPKNKKPIGERLTAVAFDREYNQFGVVFQGPVVDEVQFDKNNAYIYFKSQALGPGLQINDGQPPEFFYVAEGNRVFYPAEAPIDGSHVVLRSSHVNRLASVRYAFFNYQVTNLENKVGFPAIPFRTDV